MVPRPARAKTWRAELRRNFDARVQDLERVRAALAAQHVPFAPPEAVAATLVAGFVAFDAGASDATRLESACTLYLGCASNPPSRARGVIQSCVAALERGENVGAGVQGALNALQDPTLLVEVGPRCCAVRNSLIASRVAAAAVRIGGEGPRADACRAAYLHLLASTQRTRRLDAPLLEEGALRRACDALTSEADARILAVLMDLAPKAPSDDALPSSVARAASMLVQTLPIEIQGERMDDSSDSTTRARGTLPADALSDAFAARDRRPPRVHRPRQARTPRAWLCDKATTHQKRRKQPRALVPRCSRGARRRKLY